MIAPAAETRTKTCSGCGSPFACGAGTGAESECWCTGLPPLLTLLPNADCLCPPCLREAIATQPASPNAAV